MTIRYALTRYKLDDNSHTCKAIVKPFGTVDLEDLVERIADRGSTVGKADTLAVLMDFFDVVECALLDGEIVTTPLANFRVSVQGTFDGFDDKYDPRRHKIVPRIIPGKRLRRAFRWRARAVKRGAVISEPNPVAYTDIASETRNSFLTPGGIGRLMGYQLKFDPDDPEQGIFFFAADKSGWRAAGATRVEKIVTNTPSESIFLVPDLAAGDYRLEVRATPRNCTQVRSGVLWKRLTVPSQGDAGHPPAPDEALALEMTTPAITSDVTTDSPAATPGFGESRSMIRRIPLHDSTNPAP